MKTTPSTLVVMALSAILVFSIISCGGEERGSTGGPGTVDTTPPTVTSTTPAEYATDVAVNTSITSTFSEAMDPSTINTSTFILKDSGNNPVSGTVSYSGTAATFAPNADLAYSTTYTATITTGAKDLASNEMTGDYVFGFTTDTQPTVTITTPAEGATDVAVNTSITSTFSEAMDPATINTSTFILKDSGNNPVSGTVSYSGTEATFTPDADLAYSTTYTATITTGAKDLAGNALAGEYYWSFTTPFTLGSAELIESNSNRAGCPAIAIGSTGNALVVWLQGPTHSSDDLWSNLYVSGVGWGSPELIESGSLDIWGCPEIDIDSNGNAIAVWSQSGVIMANRYVAGTGWGTPEAVGGSSGLDPDISIDTTGNAIAVWEDQRNIWASRYLVGTGWGAPVLLESNSGEAYRPRVVVDQYGNATAVWVHQVIGLLFRIWANRFTAGTGWGTAELIDNDTGGSILNSAIAIDIDTNGNSFATWSQGEGSGYRIWANRYVVGTGWNTAEPLESTVADISWGATVTVDSTGNAFVIWSRRDDATDNNIWANRYTAGTGWGGEEVIAFTTDLPFPAVAANLEGTFTIVWGTTDKVLALQYSTSEGWGTKKLLNTIFGSAYGLRIASDDNNFIAVWSQAEDATYNIYANRFQ